MRGALLAAMTVGVAAQSREPSQWDNLTETCSVASPTGATISAITQTTMDSVTVTYSNYGGSGPTSLWLTNQHGTIIAYDENGLSGASKVLSFQALSLAEMPTNVNAHTCPPSTTFTTPKRMWRGVYEDATNNCCSDQLPTTQETTDYTPVISVNTGNGDGSWNQQEFTFTTPQKSPIMFAQDDSGRILKLVENAAPIAAGTYSSGTITLPAMTKSVRACSMLTITDVANQKNPICTERSFLTDIAASLEADGSNPSLQTANWFLNKTYSGSSASPVVVFERDFTPNIGEYCIMYARDGTVTGPILGMSSGALEIELNVATASLTTGNSLFVYSCCNVVYDPFPFGGSRTVPYTCPSGELYSFAFDAAAEKTLAAAAISAASQGGVGSLSLSSGQRCDDGISAPGDWRVNNSAAGVLNCTCTAPDGGFGDYTWQCVAIYANKQPTWRDSAIIAVVMVGVIAVLIVAVALGYVFMQRDKAPRPSQFGSVKFAGDPAGGSTVTDTYM